MKTAILTVSAAAVFALLSAPHSNAEDVQLPAPLLARLTAQPLNYTPLRNAYGRHGVRVANDCIEYCQNVRQQCIAVGRDRSDCDDDYEACKDSC